MYGLERCHLRAHRVITRSSMTVNIFWRQGKRELLDAKALKCSQARSQRSTRTGTQLAYTALPISSRSNRNAQKRCLHHEDIWQAQGQRR